MISSIVAPEPGSGALVAMVKNAKGAPVKNLPVQAIGPKNTTKPTNDAGCAVFGAVDGGGLRGQGQPARLGRPRGQQEVIKTATVSAGTLTTVDFVYDVAATAHGQRAVGPGGPRRADADDSYGVIAAQTGILTGYRLFPAAPTLAADPHAQRPVPVRGRLQDLQRPLRRPGPDGLP